MWAIVWRVVLATAPETTLAMGTVIRDDLGEALTDAGARVTAAMSAVATSIWAGTDPVVAATMHLGRAR